jgi:hypothetical protein
VGYRGIGVRFSVGTRDLSLLHKVQTCSGALSLELKRTGGEADHSPPPNAEVKNAWSYTSMPPIITGTLPYQNPI